MGVIRVGFLLGLGAVWGMYLAQNYYVPDVKKTLEDFSYKTKRMEENHRKKFNNDRDKP